MRRLGSTTSVLKILLTLLILASASPVHALKSLGYNLQGMRPGSNWQVRLYFIGQHLIELEPDILLLQEVSENQDGSSNQAETLASTLSAALGVDYTSHFAFTHISWDIFREGVGIVTRFPVLNQGHRSLTSGVFPRKAIWTRVQADDGILHAFSTHFSYPADYNQVRLAQAADLREFVLERLSEWPGIALVGGDFNCTPPSDPMQFLTSSHPDSAFTDTWAYLNPQQNGYTMPADAPTSRIDFQLMMRHENAQLQQMHLEMNEPFDGTNYMSDHLGTSLEFDELSSIDQPATITRDFLLHPAWPNPFNPTVELGWTQHQAGTVRLRVFDLLGREIRELLQGRYLPGLHRVSFDATGLPSGLYLIHLESEQDAQSIKVLKI
jgi:endonuclease/exonuclease/phosphatase family metal-dependent hydrolase